jgi:hypothetical protein
LEGQAPTMGLIDAILMPVELFFKIKAGQKGSLMAK